MSRWIAVTALCPVLSAFCASVQAQSRPSEVGIRFAVAPYSSFQTRVGTSHRDFYEMEVHAAWTLGGDSDVAVRYTADLIPLALSTHNPNAVEERSCTTPYSGECTYTALLTGTVYGAGLAPVGLELELFRRAPIAVRLSGALGFLWFDHAVPDPEARRFNFTVAGGASIRVAVHSTWSLELGYLRHHTSNAGTSRANPGLNANVFSFGILAERRRR